MQTLTLTPQNHAEVIAAAVNVLQAGGLVIFPTETTYGAGVNALNQAGVDKLLAYKARREGKPLSIAVTDLAMAEKFVNVNESAKNIYARFLPGPVTVVSESKHTVAKGVESEYGTVGVRIPAYPLVLEMVTKLGAPITATSANGSGAKRPYTIQDIFDDLSEKQKSLIDLVIDAGTLPPNPPSTVIDTTLSTPVVFRQGQLEVAQKPADNRQIFISKSEQETKDIAKRFMLKYWNELKETGLVIGLNGSLGAGKTIFTKGIAEFLQITDTLTSPTYVYLLDYAYERHSIKGELHHLDLWRLEKPELLAQLELPKLFGPNQVVVIEWPSLVAAEILAMTKTAHIPYLELTITEDPQTTQRTLELSEHPATP
jgi:L-threonylcarbamoyladenylate synthase